MTVQPANHRYTYEEEQRRLDASPLQDVLTIAEVSFYYRKHPRTVRNAIDLHKLITRKADAEEGVKGGIYLIERKSCDQLWGRAVFDAYRFPFDKIAQTYVDPNQLPMFTEENDLDQPNE